MKIEVLYHGDINRNIHRFRSFKDIPHYDKISKLTCVGTIKEDDMPYFPPYIHTIILKHNDIELLPELPNSVFSLTCIYNKIVQLPELPYNLVHLSVIDNHLNSLPTLPPKLERLICNCNFIKNIPDLPSSLIELRLTGNYIQMLPSSLLNCNRLKIIEYYGNPLRLSLTQRNFIHSKINKLQFLDDIGVDVVSNTNNDETNIGDGSGGGTIDDTNHIPEGVDDDKNLQNNIQSYTAITNESVTPRPPTPSAPFDLPS